MKTITPKCPGCGSPPVSQFDQIVEFECGYTLGILRRKLRVIPRVCLEWKLKKARTEIENLHTLLARFCRSSSKAQIMQDLRDEYSDLLKSL